MITLPDREALCAALNKPLPSGLRSLLAEIIDQAAAADLLDLTYIVIPESTDGTDALAEEIGFDPLLDPIDGIRWDQPGFQPYWAYLELRGTYYVLIHTIGNGGFAFILLIEAAGDSELVLMCRRHGGQP